MAKHIDIALTANGNATRDNAGFFVFCRSATGAFSIELNGDGETLGMEAGDKITSPEIIKKVRLVDTSGAPNTVRLIMGKGGFYV